MLRRFSTRSLDTAFGSSRTGSPLPRYWTRGVGRRRYGAKQKIAKRPKPKTALRLPDLEQSKNAVPEFARGDKFPRNRTAMRRTGTTHERPPSRYRHNRQFASFGIS